jgi:hypothetical protein
MMVERASELLCGAYAFRAYAYMKRLEYGLCGINEDTRMDYRSCFIPVSCKYFMKLEARNDGRKKVERRKVTGNRGSNHQVPIIRLLLLRANTSHFIGGT